MIKNCIYDKQENGISSKTANCMSHKIPRRDELFYILHPNENSSTPICNEQKERDYIYRSGSRPAYKFVKKSVQHDGNLYEYNSSNDDLVKITNKFGSMWIPRTEIKKMIAFLIEADRDLENV